MAYTPGCGWATGGSRSPTAPRWVRGPLQTQGKRLGDARFSHKGKCLKLLVNTSTSVQFYTILSTLLIVRISGALVEAAPHIWLGDDKGELGNNNNNMLQNNGGSSVEEEAEEDGEVSCGEVDFHEEMIDPLAEDQKLKEQLLRKYSGYICGLKQEFLKKKKKGKLPKDARQKLLDWWTQHYKWPYPSEPEKAALAETTGLDQKQINNWFINQRKRHWKPAEDMQYMMVDSPSMHHHHVHSHAHLAPHPLASYAVVETMDAAAAAAAATIMPSLHN